MILRTTIFLLFISISQLSSQRDSINNDLKEISDSMSIWMTEAFDSFIIPEMEKAIESDDFDSYTKNLILMLHYNPDKTEILEDILTEEEFEIYNQIEIEIRDSVSSYSISPVNSSYKPNGAPVITYNSPFLLRFANYIQSTLIAQNEAFNRPTYIYPFMQIALIDEYADPFEQANLTEEIIDKYDDPLYQLGYVMNLLFLTTFYELHELYHLTYEKEVSNYNQQSELAADSFAIEKLNKITIGLFGDVEEENDSNFRLGGVLDSLMNVSDLSTTYLLYSTGVHTYLSLQGLNQANYFRLTVDEITERHIAILDQIVSKLDCTKDAWLCTSLMMKRMEVLGNLDLNLELSNRLNDVDKMIEVNNDTLSALSKIILSPGNQIFTFGNKLLAEREFKAVCKVFEYALDQGLTDNSFQDEYFNFILSKIYELEFENFDKALLHLENAKRFGYRLLPPDYYELGLKKLSKNDSR